jgi:uncharacterized protein YkwD
MTHKTFAFSSFLLCCFLPSLDAFQFEGNFSKTTNEPDAWKVEMLQLVNKIRAEGCTCGRKKMPPAPPLRWNGKLEKAAQAHANDMARANYLGHRGSDGSKIGDRADRAGYDWMAVAENVSWGGSSAKDTFEGWKDSPGHCLNMMNAGYKEMGAARKGSYWAQLFGSSRQGMREWGAK